MCNMRCMCIMGLPRKTRRCRRSLLKAENEKEFHAERDGSGIFMTE